MTTLNRMYEVLSPPFSDVNTGPENDNRSLQAKNRQQCGRTKIEVGPTYNLKIGTYYSVVIWKRSRAILSNLMPMVVKIVGSTPTARTINESEVVGVLDTVV